MTLPDDQQYERYLLLKQAWSETPALYDKLSAKAQWALHTYYQPSEDLTARELSEHRQRVTTERPWLPSLAGKAFKVIAEGYRPRAAHGSRTPTVTAKPGGTKARAKRRGRDHELRVLSVRRDPPDVQKLADALIELAQEQARQAKEQPTNSHEDG